MENCNFTWKPVGTGISPTLGHRGCWPGEEREERRDKRARSGKERSRGNKRGRVTVLWMRATPGVEGNAGKMERGDGRHRCIVRMQGGGAGGRNRQNRWRNFCFLDGGARTMRRAPHFAPLLRPPFVRQQRSNFTARRDSRITDIARTTTTNDNERDDKDDRRRRCNGRTDARRLRANARGCASRTEEESTLGRRCVRSVD
jgi:hypothetical protein